MTIEPRLILVAEDVFHFSSVRLNELASSVERPAVTGPLLEV